MKYLKKFNESNFVNEGILQDISDDVIHMLRKLMYGTISIETIYKAIERTLVKKYIDNKKYSKLLHGTPNEKRKANMFFSKYPDGFDIEKLKASYISYFNDMLTKGMNKESEEDFKWIIDKISKIDFLSKYAAYLGRK
jgi:hypothetical protein